MAAADSFHTQPTAVHCAVCLHGFEKILRATRLVTATGSRSAQPKEEGRDRPLIKTDGATDDDLHALRYPARAVSARHSSVSAAKVAPTAARRRTTTIQRPAGKRPRFTRKTSRMRRRARLRSTAVPVRRAVMTPIRAGSGVELYQVPRTMKFPCCDFPWDRTAANSARRARRAGFGKVSAAIKPLGEAEQPVKRRCDARIAPRRPWAAGVCVRVGGDEPRWRDRLWFSCGRGSHAGVCGCAWKLGKFFSWDKKFVP